MRQRRFVKIALLCTTALFMSACASGPEENPELRQARGELTALKEELRSLRLERQAHQQKIAELAARGRVLETRLGVHQFKPETPKRGQKSWMFLPDEAQLIDAFGQAPRRVLMQPYTQRYGAYIVALWATWCTPCTSPEELAQLKRLKGQLEQQGSSLLGVAIDGIDKVRAHARAARARQAQGGARRLAQL